MGRKGSKMSEWNGWLDGYEYDEREKADEIQEWWEKNMDYCPDMEEK